jgi:hypothetical protein
MKTQREYLTDKLYNTLVIALIPLMAVFSALFFALMFI